MFQNRQDAGRRLAARLQIFAGQDVVIIAVPRGGVVVAAEVAKALSAPLDLVIPRKISAPGNEELAVGAVAGPDLVFIDQGAVVAEQVSESYLKTAIAKEVDETARRRQVYLKDYPEINLWRKIAIIVDDGLATGATAKVAVQAVKAQSPAQVILAVPVAPPATIRALRREVDELICLSAPASFYAVGQFYQNFSQVSDSEVVAVLNKLRQKD